MNELLALADRVLAPTYSRPPRVFVDGDGAWLTDAQGQAWLDMTSGVAVLALGHKSPIVADALKHAAGGLIHTSNLFHTAPPILLASALVERSFADRVFFVNSGAEAVEGALKFARLAAGDRRQVVYFDGSFHGRTLGALAATDRPAWQEPFAPLAGGFTRAPFDAPAALEAIDERVGAVIVEPVQGEGGVRPADPGWLASLRAACDAAGAFLIFDEVQTGLGRTGRLWAHERSGVTPDLMTLAKPLAGGLPMGAVLMTERVARAITPGCHATTFGGGPAVASVALAVLSALSEPGFLAEVERKGQLLREALQALGSPHLGEVRGQGLLVGVQTDLPAGEVVARARDEEHLLLASAGADVLRFVPPLQIPDEDLLEAVARLGRTLQRMEAR